MARKLIIIAVLALMAFVVAGSLTRKGPGTTGVAAGPDVGGKIAFAHSGSIWLYSRGEVTQLTRGPQDPQDKQDSSPAFSPDGTEIVYVRYDEGFSDLYRLSVSDPTSPVALTDHRPTLETGAEGYNLEALWALQPAWSPNGERIAFTTDRGTEYPGLFSIGVDGDNIRKLESLNHGVQAVERPSYSPDGTKIAVANYVTRNGKGQIWVVDLEAERWTEITDAENGAYDPAWSPDGEWIAFTMRDGTDNNIYVVPTDAEKWTSDYPEPVQITTDGTSRSPVWSPEGGKLAYLSLQDGSFDLYAGDVTTTGAGDIGLESVQKLTDKANIDATSQISWGR